MSGLPRAVVAELRKCTNCGLCLPSCPTFHGDEGDSPRGRVNLLRLSATEAGPEALAHLDGCLECGACHDPCPTGVRVADAVREAREARDGHGAPGSTHGAGWAHDGWSPT